MPKLPRVMPVVLAVVVGPTDVVQVYPVPSTVGHASRIALVRAMLSDAGGRELVGLPGAACYRFDDWATAVKAATALGSQVRSLPVEIADFELRSGLDVAIGPEAEAATVRRAARVASWASRNEIWLGAALAGHVRHRLPDRLVLRSVDGTGPASSAGAERIVAASEVIPNNLGHPQTSFVGREYEIEAIRSLLGGERLLTITGSPGTGKSRLASEIAARLLGQYEGGAWFVSLAPLSDPGLVMSAVATAIGAPVGPGASPIDAIAASVGILRTLLVLDNFEHLSRAAPEVSDLLVAAPSLQAIVTSQSRLALPAEQEIELRPLEVPRPGPVRPGLSGSTAVDLFAQRASTAAPGFALDAENVGIVSDICRRLDGLPLAIELAAARVKVLSPSAIAQRLDHQLAILSGGPSDRPARHRSLRAAIAWSYDLLDPSAQRLFRRLSIFRGGWTVDGATAVAGPAPGDETLDGLVTLLAASLLISEDRGRAGPRFTMLEGLREFGSERLDDAGESDLVRDLHAAHLLALVTDLEPELTGHEQAVALDQIASEHDNVRAALVHLLAADPAAGLRLGSAVWRFWQMRGHLDEGSGWMAKALLAAPEASDHELASAHAAAGGLAYWRGDLDATERHYEEVVRLRRRSADGLGVADALFDLAFVFDPSLRPPPEDVDRTTAGIQMAQEAHARYVEANHEAGIAKSEWLMGSIMARRDLGQAKPLLHSSVERFRRIGDTFGLGWALHSYGLTLVGSGEPESAATAFGEALGLFAAAGDGSATALLLDDFAEIAKTDGDAVRVARLKGAASGMRHESHADLAIANAPWLFEVGAVRGLADEAAVQRAWLDGQALSQADAIAYALGAGPDVRAGSGLRIRALGPLMVERAGKPVSDWGGPKAGNRHALAIFAFLLDRGKRGMTKDECIEVLWPDAEVHQADLHFHRTLSGLRSTLGPAPDPGPSVVLSSGRYRLADSVVSWLDETEFHERLLHAAEATDDLSAIRGLEAARTLYRGDYLDDCPLYGDSDYVEGHRRLLRDRIVDALVDLGRRYEARHDDSLASARFHEAIAASGGDCPSAAAGLQRLGVAQV